MAAAAYAGWYYYLRAEFAGLSMSEVRYIKDKFGPGSTLSSATDGVYQGKPVKAVNGQSANGQSLSLVFPIGGGPKDGQVFPFAMVHNVSEGTLVRL